MNTSYLVKIPLLALLVVIEICIPFAQNAIEIDSTAINIDAIIIHHAGGDGIQVTHSNGNGLLVNNSALSGVQVNNSAGSGLHVVHATGNGLHVAHAAGNGLHVHNAVGNGLTVVHAAADGIFVQGADGNSLDIRGGQSGGLSPDHGFTAYIENFGSDRTNNVLALRLNEPTFLDKYITFFGDLDVGNGIYDVLGFIAPNGTGGITFDTGGSDYAEYLEKRDRAELFEAGDIVGVASGMISHQTDSAQMVMVITDQAAITGNAPNVLKHERTEHEIVSFMGQVRTKVKGKVNEGDWIVSSGKNDGVGVALPTDQLTLDHKIVGQAWESSSNQGVKRIKTAVGLDQSEVLKHVIKEQNKQIRLQQDQIDELRAMVMEIKTGS